MLYFNLKKALASPLQGRETNVFKRFPQFVFAMTPFDYIDRHSKQMLKFLGDIIRVPTVNPPGDKYDQMTALLSSKLTSLGLTTKRYSVPKSILKDALAPEFLNYPRFNVLGKLKGKNSKRTVHFNAHYDVVPVSGVWKHGGPFSGKVSGGHIYGRGTADMKGSIASLTLALESLAATKIKPNLNVEVSLTADEETDSALGTGWMIHNTPINPNYAIVMEGGEKDMVCCGHGGVIWLEVAVHGKPAHGSMPQNGINALEKMSALILALEDYKKRLRKTSFKTPSGDIRYPTINVGGVFESGPGGKINTVPSYGSFSIDRRVLAVENHPSAEKDLRNFLISAAKKIPQCCITIRKISENYACFTPPTHPFFKLVGRSLEKVRKEPAVFSVSTGFNDMQFFASELKIPTVGYGPGGDDYHAVNEKVSVNDLVDSAKIYADILTSFEG
ncbi:MAG: M20 family metallopeptidase [Verrucomicrobia bacterium]|nr:MAG: M20 family metallopeptidase [Verrucomicrobiota bacterium]